MNPISFFISGISTTLAWCWPSSTKFPFAFPAKAVASDWGNIGDDLKLAIKKLEGKHEAS